MGDVNQLVQEELVSFVHAGGSLILTEVFVLALQSIVVLDSLRLSLHRLLERSMPLDFLQLLFMVIVASIPILKHIRVVLHVSRCLHFLSVCQVGAPTMMPSKAA